MVACGENFPPKCAESVTLAVNFPTIFFNEIQQNFFSLIEKSLRDVLALCVLSGM